MCGLHERSRRMESKSFVILNVPQVQCIEDLLTDYLEVVLNQSVEHIQYFPQLPDRALVTLQQAIGVKEAALEILNISLEGRQLGIEACIFRDHVVVATGENLMEKVPAMSVKSYFQKASGGVMSRCVAVEDCQMILVCFEDSTVVADILQCPLHCPLPSVEYEMKVGQFCDNFHGHIAHGNKLLRHLVDGKGDKSSSYSYEQVKSFWTSQSFSSSSVKQKEQKAIEGARVCKKYPHSIMTDKNDSETPVMDKPEEDGHDSCLPLRQPWTGTKEKMNKPMKSYVHGQCSSKAVGIAREFDHQSVFEFPTDDMGDHGVRLDDQVLPSKSYQDNTNTVFSGRSGQATETRRTLETASDFHAIHPDEDNFHQKRGQKDPSTSEIHLPLRKSHWYLVKDSVREMNFYTVNYDEEEEVLAFGRLPDDEVDVESIKDKVADILEKKERLSESMQRVFETSHGKEFWTNYMLTELSKHHDTFVDIRDGFLTCCGFDDRRIDEVHRNVKTDLFSVVEVENQTLPLEAVEELKKLLESRLKVHILWKEEKAKTIQVSGIKHDVIAAKDWICKKMDDDMTTSDYFEFYGDMAMYISDVCWQEIEGILKKVEYSVDSTDDKLHIKYSGKLQDLKEVSSAFGDLCLSLKSEEIDVEHEFSKEEAYLLKKELSLLSPDSSFQNVHDWFMEKHECLIINDLDKKADDQSSSPVVPLKSQEIGYTHKTSSSKEAIFILSRLMHLEIKRRGNIIQEKSDVLVCVLDESRQLSKTSVGEAFLRIKKDLQNTVDKLSFSPEGVKLVPFPSLESKCSAIAFVLLPAFKHVVREDCLQKAVLEVLKEAAEFNAQSISFPPIGLGRVMKYPDNVISEQFLSAVQEFTENYTSRHQLQVIKFLASVRSLFNTLNAKGKRSFRKVMKEDTMEGTAQMDRMKKEHVGNGDDKLMGTNAHIRIIHLQRSESLVSHWTTELKNYMSYEEEIDTLLERVPKSLNDKIKSELKMIPVLITHESQLDHCVVKIKGPMDRVRQMKTFIEKEIMKQGKGQCQRCSSPFGQRCSSPFGQRCSSPFGQRCSSPSKVPRRGTVAFMKYLLKNPKQLSVPTYWEKKEGSDRDRYPILGRTKQSFENLLLKTWDQSLVGQGRDAKNIPTKSRLELVSVERIECPTTFNVYAAKRTAFLQRKVAEGKVCKGVEEISLRKGCVLTSVNLPNYMKQELCGEINECYLFHGTKQELVEPILRQGCQPNLTNPSAMLGRGVYAAESATKADQYTDDPTERMKSGSIHYMFLLRMLLGDVFRCTKKHPSITGNESGRFVRPPCKKCYMDKCTCGENFDSVMGDEGWIFREFVIYESTQCYPEYLITYKRVH